MSAGQTGKASYSAVAMISSTAARSAGQWMIGRDWSMAVCGSLSPWPVSTATNVSPRGRPGAAVLEQPSDAGRRGGLAEHALFLGQQPLGRQDLLVGDVADDAARVTRGRERFLRSAGLPMRMAVATVSGCSTISPRTSGLAPSAWKPHTTGNRLGLSAVSGTP